MHIDTSVYPIACLPSHCIRFHLDQCTRSRKYRRRNAASGDTSLANIRSDKPCGWSLLLVWSYHLVLQQW